MRTPPLIEKLGGPLAGAGGASTAWFVSVFMQGRYHLYEGFKRNEYFTPPDGFAYIDTGIFLWICFGAGIGLGLFHLLARMNTERRPVSWLGLPSLTLLAPLIASSAGKTNLLLVLHAVVIAGITTSLVAFHLSKDSEEDNCLRRVWFAVFIFIVVIHFLLLAWLNILQYRALNLGFPDSGRIAESLSQTLRGNFMLSYNQSYIYGGNPFEPQTSMEHLFLTQIFMVPLYWLFPYHETLLVLNALMLSMAALPLFLLAREKSRSAVFALLVGLAYLLYPPMLYVNFRSSYGPDNEAQGLFCLMWACYAMGTNRPRQCIIWCILTILVKENFAPMTMMFGVVMALQTPARKTGLGIAAGSVLYFVVGTKLILPHLAKGGYSFVIGYYDHIGGSFSEIAWALISRPVNTFHLLFNYRNIVFLLHLLCPLILLPLVRPFWLLLLGPSLVFLLISANPMHQSILFWNHTTLIPILFSGAVLGAQALPSFLKVAAPQNGRKLLLGAGWGVLAASSMSSYLFFFRMMTPETFEVSKRDELVNEIRNLIPRDSSVLASYRLASHFTDYGMINVMDRHPLKDQDYLVFDPFDRYTNYGMMLAARDAALLKPEYHLVFRKHKLYVFRRGAGFDKKHDALATRPLSIGTPVNQVTDGAKLLGWSPLSPVGPRTIQLETFWECIQPMEKEYEVVIEFQLLNGKKISARHLMADWLYPTTIWRTGDLVRDVAQIQFDHDRPKIKGLTVRLVEWSE
jgi:uncharacterized membrane protein